MTVFLVEEEPLDGALSERVRAAAEEVRRLRDLGEIAFLDAHADRTLLPRLLRAARRLVEKGGELIVSPDGEDVEGFRAARRRFPSDFRERVVVVTRPAGGRLREEVARTGVEAFPMPPLADEHLQTFTAAGLLRLALAGLDIEAFLSGSAAAQAAFEGGDPAEHPAGRLAAHHTRTRSGPPGPEDLRAEPEDDFGRGELAQTLLLAIAIHDRL